MADDLTDDELELIYAEQEADYYGRWIEMGDYIRRLRRMVHGEGPDQEKAKAEHEAELLKILDARQDDPGDAS